MAQSALSALSAILVWRATFAQSTTFAPPSYLGSTTAAVPRLDPALLGFAGGGDWRSARLVARGANENGEPTRRARAGRAPSRRPRVLTKRAWGGWRQQSNAARTIENAAKTIETERGRRDAAISRIVRGDGSRRRRGCHVDSPWGRVAATPQCLADSPRGRVAATPRVPRG